MGSPTILYFGKDDCLRIPVLKVAGFRVAQCVSLVELERWLQDALEPAAVIFEEGHSRSADEAARVARQISRAALVLFRHPAGDSSDDKFDLIVGPATAPARWLQQLSEILLARAGFAEATPGWGEIARQLQTRRRDVPAGSGSSRRGYGIQPEKRRCT